MKNKNFDFSRITFNAGLLVKELLKRRVKVDYFGASEVMRAKLKSHEEILLDIHTSLIPYTLGWILNDKFYTKKWLFENGFSVADGKTFKTSEVSTAIKYAKKLGFPVVLKPTVASHGDGVWLNIQSQLELKNKIKLFQKAYYHNSFMIVEQYRPGNEYRLFLTRNGFFAAVLRKPASIIGDGVSTIKQLVEKENWRRMNPRINCLCEIPLDNITLDFMTRQKLALEYIPKNNQEIALRENSNVSTGGNCLDVTDLVHDSVKQLAFQLLQKFEILPYIGIDLICDDITKPLSDYIICEFNTAPGLSLHMLPAEGESRNVAAALADLLFPETKNATY